MRVRDPAEVRAQLRSLVGGEIDEELSQLIASTGAHLRPSRLLLEARQELLEVGDGPLAIASPEPTGGERLLHCVHEPRVVT